jgi:signal recognition particle subunit SRP54
MFETLSDRLYGIFENIGKKGHLTEEDVDQAMREVRRALLEADVNFKVVRDFVSAVRERAVGEEVLRAVTPAQQVIGIVNEELVKILGNERVPLVTASQPPTVIMLVGLQGSGKTTHIAKLAKHLREEGQSPMLVAADVYRPAAIDQLHTLGRQIDMPVYSEEGEADPVKIAWNGIKAAKDRSASVVLVDTAGRLQIDERMMTELVDLTERIEPHETLLVADAMTGQEAVSVAETFHERLNLTGLILTKMDGDARGGAALSIRSVVGVPIKFIGTGENVDALEPFYPDRLAGRILGMGDVVSLVERAQQQMSEEDTHKLEEKVLEGRFNLEDFLSQLQQLKQMGPLTQLLDMIPGIGQAMRQSNVQISDDQYKHVEAMIYSMTPEERRHPDIIKPSRRKRIAAGSGTTSDQVNQMLNQFRQMQKMMSQMGQMGMGSGKKKGGLRSLLGGGGNNPLAGMSESDLEQMMGGSGMPGGLPDGMPGGLPGMSGGGGGSNRGSSTQIKPKHANKRKKKKKSKGKKR